MSLSLIVQYIILFAVIAFAVYFLLRSIFHKTKTNGNQQCCDCAIKDACKTTKKPKDTKNCKKDLEN